MIDLALLVTKYLFLALIYLFLLWLVLVMLRDVRQQIQAPSAGRRPAYLRVRQGPVEGQAIPLTDRLLIGRAAENDLALDDDAVSSRHAALTATAAGWTIEDLGSTNGTLVDGVRISGATALRPGALIAIGRSQLELVER